MKFVVVETTKALQNSTLGCRETDIDKKNKNVLSHREQKVTDISLKLDNLRSWIAVFEGSF